MSKQKSYTLVPTPKFLKQMKKYDKFVQKNIKNYMENLVKDGKNPRDKGKGLTSNRSGQWRYRIGDYRVIVNIQDDKMIVLALETGHRREIY